MQWWVWALVAIALFAVEAFGGTAFYVFFLGTGALVSAIATGLGLTDSPAEQWYVCGVAGFGSLLLFRARLVRAARSPEVKTDRGGPVGETVRADGIIPPGGEGRVSWHGSGWSARNVGRTALADGEECVVESVTGVTLSVKGAGHVAAPGR